MLINGHYTTTFYARFIVAIVFALCSKVCLSQAGGQASSSSSGSSSSLITTSTLETSDTWVSYVGLGAQFLPDYSSTDTEKKNLFSKQQLFADIVVDGKFGSECSNGNSWNWCFGQPHVGFRMLMLGTPIDKTENATNAPAKFDDIASALVFAPHATFTLLQGPETSTIGGTTIHSVAVLIRSGIISRETITATKDSAAWFYQAGIQYSHDAYRKEGKWNGLPDLLATLSVARFEDYANLGRKTRLIIDVGYQIPGSSRFYIGFKANAGKGPDDFGAYVAWYFTLEKLASIFSSDAPKSAGATN